MDPMTSFTIDSSFFSAKEPESGLYVVATPIGNLADITIRALQVLSKADVIACEDTRVTRGLLNRFSIKADCVAYHEHNADQQTPRLLERLAAGEIVCLVGDAGTPLISDPGYRLVNAALKEDIRVFPLPGASAPIAALSVSGLPTDAFFFAGFLPTKSGARKRRLQEVAKVPGTLAFFESPKRIADMLRDAADVLGDDCSGVVAREITKLFETFKRGSLRELADYYAQEGAPKGEIVVLIEKAQEESISDEVIEERIKELLQQYRVKEVADMLAAETGLAKRELYARAQRIKDESA